ncbi:MAG: hypothetical protein HY897_25905 [Deltaproteobacteria bacterium]|nr:hypothetical protein [Deltaproteobacteria bacterium]
MGLDNFPSPYPCKVGGYAKLTKEEKIDCEATTDCPFKGDNNPQGILGTYCWFRGKTLAFELDAIGKKKLSERCYENLSAEEADEFGERLLKLAGRLRKRYRDVPPEKQPRGAGWDLTFDKKSKTWTAGSYSTFAEVLETLEAGRRWYQKVASLGSGVEAWY